MRGCGVRYAGGMTFHQEREPAAFLGNVFDDFGFTLPDNACVKATALAIIVFMNFDAILNAHAECHIRILADAVELLADMRAVEVQLQNAALQAVSE